MSETNYLEAARRLSRERAEHFKRIAPFLHNARKLRLERGMLWRPLFDFFVPLGLLPVDAGVSALKRDWTYTVSRIAMKNPALYAPMMKKIVEWIRNRETEPMIILDVNHSPDEWNRIRNFIRELDRAAALQTCSFLPHSWSVIPDAKFRRYFEGEWAEQGLLYLIEKVTKQFSQANGFSHSIFWNVKLVDKSPWVNTAMELDAVAFVENHAYVFEIKTGALLNNAKWFNRWKLFFNPGWSTFIQCTTKPIDPTKYEPFAVFPMTGFERMFNETLCRDFSIHPARILESEPKPIQTSK